MCTRCSRARRRFRIGQTLARLNGEGNRAAGIGVTEEDVGERVPDLLAAVPGVLPPDQRIPVGITRVIGQRAAVRRDLGGVRGGDSGGLGRGIGPLRRRCAVGYDLEQCAGFVDEVREQIAEYRMSLRNQTLRPVRSRQGAKRRGATGSRAAPYITGGQAVCIALTTR